MINSIDAYLGYIKRCLDKYPDIDEAMRFIVSSDGRPIKSRGDEELRFLLNEGLGKDDYFIDVGCGAGALLQTGIANHCRIYQGLDIDPSIVRYANRYGDDDGYMTYCCGLSSNHPDVADWVVFFSVFSHMLDHEIYRYLQDTFRVLKPGGKVVFTYRDWSNPGQWAVFMNQVKPDDKPDKIPIFSSLQRSQTVRYWLKKIGFSRGRFYHPMLLPAKTVLGQTTVVARKS